MELHEIIGFVAGFGTTFATMPDLIATGIMDIFQIVWVYYGFLIDSRPVIVWNMVAVAINGLTVGAYFYFARRQKTL